MGSILDMFLQVLLMSISALVICLVIMYIFIVSCLVTLIIYKTIKHIFSLIYRKFN